MGIGEKMHSRNSNEVPDESNEVYGEISVIKGSTSIDNIMHIT